MEKLEETLRKRDFRKNLWGRNFRSRSSMIHLPAKVLSSGFWQVS